MPSYQEHIDQANHNLTLLQAINEKIPNSWDWQVTIVFYTGVHLINAHISHKANLHYRSHADVENAINPYNPCSVAKLPEDSFLAYKQLTGLSRRSRYLINENLDNKRPDCHFTYDKHFSRAMKYLDKLIEFIRNEYNAPIHRASISCMELRMSDLIHAIVI